MEKQTKHKFLRKNRAVIFVRWLQNTSRKADKDRELAIS